MNLATLIILYACVGTGCAVVALVRGRASWSSGGDAGLLLLFWPLYGPFVIVRDREPDGRGAGDLQLAETLRLARRTPLAEILPDEAAIVRLSARVIEVSQNVSEIDRLLNDKAMSELAAEERQRELEAAGNARAAHIVSLRREQIARLRALRGRLLHELNEINELLAQLRVQAELIRLSGAPGHDSRELVSEIVFRVEGLSAVTDVLPDPSVSEERGGRGIDGL
ncbi:MAG: hypothetical protein HYY84_09510 [Deltaproteobacteria bacterium]|nr:hypothetical protein [Deltaproteobacteria bacterium]